MKRDILDDLAALAAKRDAGDIGPADFLYALRDAYPAIAAELRAARAVVEAVERTGFDINPPTGPDRHADMYSLDNETVRLIAQALTAYRRVLDKSGSEGT